jgi:hypothetical protein
MMGRLSILNWSRNQIGVLHDYPLRLGLNHRGMERALPPPHLNYRRRSRTPLMPWSIPDSKGQGRFRAQPSAMR